jgi:acyl carrier protein
MLNQLKIKFILEALVISDSVEETELIGRYLTEIVKNKRITPLKPGFSEIKEPDNITLMHKFIANHQTSGDIGNIVHQYMNKVDQTVTPLPDKKSEPGDTKIAAIKSDDAVTEIKRSSTPGKGDDSQKEQVLSILADITGNNAAEFDCDLSLRDYYGLDSIVEIELLNLLEQRFKVKLDHGFLIDHSSVNEIVNGLTRIAA